MRQAIFVWPAPTRSHRAFGSSPTTKLSDNAGKGLYVVRPLPRGCHDATQAAGATPDRAIDGDPHDPGGGDADLIPSMGLRRDHLPPRAPAAIAGRIVTD